MTPAEGVIVNDSDKDLIYYNVCKKEIMDKFVMPMQRRVYPRNRILKGFREVVIDNDSSFLRTLGTCSIKVKVDNHSLVPYGSYNVKIINSIEPKLLKAQLIL